MRERGARALRESGEPNAAVVGRELERYQGGREPDAAAEAWAVRIEARRQGLIERGGVVHCAVGASRLGRQRSFAIGLAQLARVVSGSELWGRFMLDLVRALRPSSCIEVGTAAGISSAYEAAGLELNGEGRLTCIEASPELAELTRETLSALELERAEVLTGTGRELLPGAAEAAGPFQLAFLDDDHRRRGTIEAAVLLIGALAGGGVLLIDDIHNSIGMRRAWRRVARDPRLAVAVDVGGIGVCVREA